MYVEYNCDRPIVESTYIECKIEDAVTRASYPFSNT